MSTDYDSSDAETVAYLSSGGSSSGSSPNGSSSDSFDSSNDEPLIEYKNSRKGGEGTEADDALSQSLKTYEEFTKHKRGRARGPAKAPHHDFTRPTSIAQHNVRRDHIDEECKRLGIYYKKWVPLNPDQTSHCSVRDYNDDTKVPEEQEVGEWCIMCPKNRFMWNCLLIRKHYLSVHQKKLLVIGDYKLWRCKCSEVCSHGSDNSARNVHYHCHLCFHPFKTKDLLGTHLVTQHPEIETGQVRHLLDPSNPHRRSF